MTITDFSLLTTTDKLSILYQEGVFLGKRSVGHVQVVLYQYQKLYVEIFYRKYRQAVDRIRCSEELDILAPYLKFISLERLF
jgi:hypothetical protein